MKNIKTLMMITLFSLQVFSYSDPFSVAKFFDQQRRYEEISDKNRKDMLESCSKITGENWRALLFLIMFPVDCVTGSLNYCFGYNIVSLSEYFGVNPCKEVIKINSGKRDVLEKIQNSIEDMKSFLEQADKLGYSEEDVEKYIKLLQKLNIKK